MNDTAAMLQQAPRKPLLTLGMVAGFRNLAAKVTLNDSNETQQAGRYLINLANHMDSETYDLRRNHHGDRVLLSKLKKIRELDEGKPIWIATLEGREIGYIRDRNAERAKSKALAKWGDQVVLTHHII